METFFPSEVARLVLGYLKEEKCLKSWQAFLEESSNLEEYFCLYKKGRVYSTNVNGNSLVGILNEYCVLKSEAESNRDSKIESPEKAYCISESEFFETIKKDVFAETTKNAVDLVFQKYLSSSVLSNKNNSSSNSSLEVCLSESSNSSFRNKQNQNFCNTDIIEESNADRCGDKQRNVPVVTNEIKNKINDKNKNNICIQDTIQGNLNNNKLVTGLNIAEKNNNNGLKQLKVSKNNYLQSNSTITDIKLKNVAGTSDFISKKIKYSASGTIDPAINDRCNKDLNCTKNQSIVVLENPSTTNSECTDKVNAVSLTESAQDNDADVEIVKEIKKGNLISNANCQIDLVTSNSLAQNNNPIINESANNSNNVSINQAAVCSIQSTVTQVNNSKQKVNSSESNPVMNTLTNSSSAVEMKQTVLCNVQNKVNQINNLEQNLNSSNDQAIYDIVNSPCLNQSTVVNKLPLTSTRYIIPNYSSNGSLTNNNAQFYFVLNTPIASNVGGTLVTVPRLQTNTLNSVVPAAGITNNSVATPVSILPNPTQKVAITSDTSGVSLAPSKTNSINAHENFLTASNVSRPKTTDEACRKSQTVPRVLKRVSYAEFSDSDTEPEESDSPKAKRKKTQWKSSPRKKTSKKDLVSSADQPGQVQKVSMSKEHGSDEKDFLMLTVKESHNVRRAPKENYLVKKTTNNKKKGKVLDKVSSAEVHIVKKNKQGATYNRFENYFKQHSKKEHFLRPSDPAVKTLKVATNNQGIDHGIPVSSISNSRNTSQSIFSKTVSENISNSAILNENRVLKVVLSDVFLEPNLKPDASCNQCTDSHSILIRCNEDNEDQISHSEKQDKRSTKISKKDAEQSSESKSVDTMSLQQEMKIPKSANHPLSTNIRKVDPSDGKSESTKNSSSFDATTAVLNSMEEARQLIIDSKKHSKSSGKSELNLQNSFKNISANVQQPTPAFQRVIRDICENTECIELEGNGEMIDEDKVGENINLCTAKNNALLSSLDVEKNFKSSTNESRENSENPMNFRCHKDNENVVSEEVIVLCENITSTSGKKSILAKKFLEQNNNTEKIISLKISKKDSLDTVNAEKQVAITDCIEEKKRLLTNSLSSLHHVNVNTRLSTCVTRKLNFGEKCLDFNSGPPMNESVFNAKNNTKDKEDSRNFSHCEIFNSESDSFQSVNIKDGNSDFICQTSETSVFSVLTSISANTEILDITEKHIERKPHSDIFGVSSLEGKNAKTVILPSTSKQSLESQKCIL